MFGTWWIVWLAFVFIFLMPPIGYGWGYRGWGMPYPRYMQRRRAAAYAADGGGTTNHHAWGWGGDYVWFMLMFMAVWAVSGFWWRPGLLGR